MTWLLDPEQPKLLRLTVSLLLASQLAASAHQIVVAVSGQSLINAVIASVLLLGALGLYRRVRWGRIMSLVFVWGLVLVALGSMNPLRIGDDLAAGLEPPSITVLVAQCALVACYALWCIRILNKYKRQFSAAWF